jgi:hypothetical protein
MLVWTVFVSRMGVLTGLLGGPPCGICYIED